MKKGAELTISTIIIIILGLVVLVVLALGFTMGWNNLWTKMNVFAPASNVGTMSTACKIACVQNSAQSFCLEQRNLIIERGKQTTGTCLDFSQNQGLGIEKCDVCAGQSSPGCKIKDKIDKNCDGVADVTETQSDPGIKIAYNPNIQSGAIAVNLPPESLIKYYKSLKANKESESA